MAIELRPYLKRISLKPSEEQRDSFPFDLPAVRAITNIEFDRDVTFFVGENGSGKSTVLEAIAVAMGLSPQGGTRDYTAEDRFGLSPLHEHLRITRNYKPPLDRFYLRAESLFSLADYLHDSGLGFARFGGKSPHRQSHGESFLSILNRTFTGKGLYILDEPEAALSAERQLAALVRIHDLVQDESQFIIATHSPILMAYPNSRIYFFSGEGITEMQYEDTPHYKVTRDFLNNYPRRLQQLLND